MTPQKSRNTKIIRFAKKKMSRPRSPKAPIIVPNAVHENEHTTTISAIIGIEPAANEKSSSSQPTTKPTVETMTPFAMFGSARPRKSASRFAGVTRIDESVCVQRSPPIVIAIPKMPPSEQIATALPITKNLSDCEPRIAADIGEEQDLEDRAAEHRRHVHRPVDPIEERAVGEVAADEEDRGGVHRSESVARLRRARTSK